MNTALPSILSTAIVAPLLPGIAAHGHKGSYGSVLVVGGSEQFIGAPLLAATAAYRVGAGLVSLGLDERLKAFVTLRQLGFTYHWLSGEQDPMATLGLDKYQALIIGPGWGNPTQRTDLVQLLLKSAQSMALPVVLDADGLNAVDGHILENLATAWKSVPVLTPHPKEFCRLTKITMAELQQNRLHLALKYAKLYGAVMVLKGADTVIALPDGQSWVNDADIPALSVAGTGDVLAGMIGGLLAQGLSPANASKAGVFVHAMTGQSWQKQDKKRGMMGDDLLAIIPSMLQQLRENYANQTRI